jgi:hypothetical protein
MKQYLTWLPLLIVSISLITGLAIAKNSVEINSKEIDKLKLQTDGIDVIQVEQKHMKSDIKDIKENIKEILRLMRK